MPANKVQLLFVKLKRVFNRVGSKKPNPKNRTKKTEPKKPTKNPM